MLFWSNADEARLSHHRALRLQGEKASLLGKTSGLKTPRKTNKKLRVSASLLSLQGTVADALCEFITKL